MFKRILVANRGEIALRVIRACRELGIETVAIYSEADRGAQYLELADEAYCVGPPRGTDSYLKIDRVISAAEIGNVQAIHPGYGFLSENAHFNEVCRSCNIDFIGPSHDAMRRLGDKNEARKLAREANVPTVPGSEGLITDERQAIKVAHEIGFPVLIKASAGGGGRGMRVALNDLSLKSAIQQAQAEAAAAFGNPAIYLEKYIEHPRHVEVQILADLHGSAVHLWERDCTMQRRHQKVIEEAPAPLLSARARAKIGERCAEACRKIGYEGAGTFEFLYEGNEFYFIEMNTRLQVEHPVTELITGLDLVQLQIRIAAGEKLTVKQRDVVLKGHAIECRVNAEDPYNFTPSPGRITSLHMPGGPGVRVDSHAYSGYFVPPNYDSLLGKIIAYGDTREQAIARLNIALSETVIEGIKTNLPLHQELLHDAAFLRGGTSIHYLEQKLAKLVREE